MYLCIVRLVSVYRQAYSMYVCVYMYVRACVTKVALQLATNSFAHTWLHSSTFRHSDESHAPFLHFCSHGVLLGHTGSYLAVSHTYNQSAELSLCLQQKLDIIKCVKFSTMLFSDFSLVPVMSWLWTFGSRWPLQQPLYVNSAVIRPECDISKIVPVHSHQMAATQ